MKIKLNKNHPMNKYSVVEKMPTKFLHKIKNPNATEYSNLKNKLDEKDLEIVHQEEIWKDIIKNGMQEPMIIRISIKEKSIRLESGNHRIAMALKYKCLKIPIACFVDVESILYEGNGTHKFDASDIIDFDKLTICPYPYQIKLTDFLKVSKKKLKKTKLKLIE